MKMLVLVEKKRIEDVKEICMNGGNKDKKFNNL
jgi:hypothetical protein